MKFLRIITAVMLSAAVLANYNNKAASSATKPTKTLAITFPRVRSRWAIAAPIAYVLGAAISFCWASETLDEGTTPEKLITLLTVSIVIGMLLGGIGQLMRAAAHGAVSRGGKLVDGLGKVVGLGGWSFGLVGTVLFAMEGIEEPEWLMKMVVIAMLAIPATAVFVSLISIRRVAV